MTPARSVFFATAGLLTLIAACATMTAHADEYSDVSQLVEAGKLAQAMSKVDSHLAAKPGDPQMRFLQGVIQGDSGKLSNAIATYTQLTEDYPELPEPYNNLAVLYAGQNQFDKARAALEMAIRINPGYATAHENLGDVYVRLAGQAYGKVLQIDSGNAAVPPKLALIRELFQLRIKSQPAGLGSRPTPPAAAPGSAAPPGPASQ